MPRSIQDILDHGDELVRRFEEYVPDEADELAVEEYLLKRAALERARSERHRVDVGGLVSAPWMSYGVAMIDAVGSEPRSVRVRAVEPRRIREETLTLARSGPWPAIAGSSLLRKPCMKIQRWRR